MDILCYLFTYVKKKKYFEKQTKFDMKWRSGEK